MAKNCCRNRIVAYSCMLFFFLLGIACIVQLFFVPAAVDKVFKDGIRNQIVMTQEDQDANTQEYRDWVSNYNEDAPLQLFEFWIYNVTNPYEVPQGAYPEFDLLGPFTFRRYENRSGPGDLTEPLFTKDDNDSLVIFEYLYHFEYLPERSVNISLDEDIWTISGAMQGLFNTIDSFVGGGEFFPCVDEALEDFPGHSVFFHGSIRNLTYGYRDPWVQDEIDKFCADDTDWDEFRPNTFFRLLASGNNAVTMHTGENDIKRIGELEEFRNWTVPQVNSDKFQPGDLWRDHEETVSGTRETRNWPPDDHVTKDSRLTVWSIEKFRATDYVYEKDVTFKGVQLMQFRLDQSELLACRYTYNTSCSESPTPSPTNAPSVPSMSPTPSPSDPPTTVTTNPTVSPSVSPTVATVNPTTASPTSDSDAPSFSPSVPPTTAEPTGATASPTSPTPRPTWPPNTRRPTRSPTCSYISGESHTCKYYQFWEDGVANLTNLRGAPSFLSKGRFLDAPFFINDTNRAFGLPLPDRDEDDQYFDIDPRTGIVFRNYHNYQINIRFLETNRPYPTNFTNFSIYNKLIPMAYVRVEAIATDEQMDSYKAILNQIDLVNGFSLYGGPSVAVLCFGIMFIIFCQLKRDQSGSTGQYGRLVEDQQSNAPVSQKHVDISMQQSNYGATKEMEPVSKMAKWESCSSITQCNNCTQWGCIWCGDELGCHAEFSPYGCLTAVACDDVKHCQRKQPEPLPRTDYAHVNALATFIIIVVSICILIALWLIMKFVRKYRSKQLKLTQRKREDIELDRFLKDPYLPLPNDDEDGPNILPFQSISSSMNSSAFSIRSFRQNRPPIVVHKDKYVRMTFFCVAISMICTIVLSIVSILLFPTTPNYYVCNTQLDWNSIWSSLMHGSVQTNYDNLFTVKNNNYFSVELRNIGVRIYYKKSLIGHYFSKDASVYIPSHSLTDILAAITFTPDSDQIAEIYALYEQNNLPLEIEFHADTSTYLFDKSYHLKVLDMHLSMHEDDYVVGASIPTDRADCNCPDKPA